MGEFQHEVEALARLIADARRNTEGGKLRSGELAGLAVEAANEVVNCYPGELVIGCCEKAFFISLSIKLAGSSRPHLKLNEAFDAMAKHCNGGCKKRTRVAILLTDNWDAELYEEWRPTIENFEGVYFEAYLLNGDNVTRIRI